MDVRHAVILALATVPLSACPTTWNCHPDREIFTIDEVITTDQLNELLTDVDADSVVLDTLDCEGICHKLYRDNTAWFVNEIDSCSLILPKRATGVEQPGHIICQGIGIEGYCVGRRPIDHIEGGDPSCRDALGRSLAAMAYLEAASVIAFEQLAVQLQGWGAPLQLIFRCRNAANDERRHARWITVLANQRGAKVPAPALDSKEMHSEIQSVALHNAVEGCVNESYSALLAAFFSQGAKQQVLRSLFSRLSADEIRHGQLAWDLHAWLCTQLDEPAKRRVNTAQREAFNRLRSEETARWTAALPSELGPPSFEQAQALATSFSHALTVN